MDKLKYVSKIEDGILNIFFSGEFTDESLRINSYKIIKSILDQPNVVLDLSNVAFISQEGLSFLIFLYNQAKADDATFTIKGCRGQVTEALRRTGLDNFLPTILTEEPLAKHDLAPKV